MPFPQILQIMISTMATSPANTTYGENTGVLSLTKVFDPMVIRLAAVFAILFSFCPKFAAVIGCMPSATVGGVSLVLYGMISAVGVRNVVESLHRIFYYFMPKAWGLSILLLTHNREIHPGIPGFLLAEYIIFAGQHRIEDNSYKSSYRKSGKADGDRSHRKRNRPCLAVPDARYAL